MKTFLLGLTTTLVWLSASIATAQWPTATYSGRTWDFEAGTRLMDRPGTELNLPLVNDALTNQVLFNSNDASDLEMSPGFDLRFLRQNNYELQWELEVSYNQWDIFTNVTSANGLSSPFFVAISDFITTNVPAANNIQFNSMDYDYESYLFSIELNARRAVAPGFTLLAGPRIMYLEDMLNISTNGTFDIGATTIPFTQNTQITTENPLFGFQVGSDVHVPLNRQIYMTGFIKAGAYGNTARSVVFQSDSLTGGTAIFSHRRSQGTFVGEVGGKLNYDLFPGIVSVFAGYEAMWLDNVAIGPPQLLGSLTGSFANVEMTGTPFVHGIVIGGTIRR